MIEMDEEALICDFAEYYHIYDYRALPPKQAAVLAGGLREDSRIIKKMTGCEAGQRDLLLASIKDHLAMIQYMLGADKRSKKPELITEKILEGQKPKETGYDSYEEFRKAWDNY